MKAASALKRLGGPALAVAVSVGAALFASPGAPAAARSGPAPAPEIERTFLADCAICHGAEAKGTDRGPSLVGAGAAAVDFQLSTGRMPLAIASRTEEPGREARPAPQRTPAEPTAPTQRHAPAYSQEVIDQLVAYVASLTGGSGPAIPDVGEGEVASGGQLYRLNCAACHSWAGTGGALVHREAPGLQKATPLETAEAVRVGPGRMPAFGEAALSDSQLDDVVAYVQEIQSPEDRGGVDLAHIGPVAEGAAVGVALVALLLSLRVIGQRR